MGRPGGVRCLQSTLPVRCLADELDRAGFGVSLGSACASDSDLASHVLAVMGVLTRGNVRVSLPRGTMQEEVAEFLAVLPGIVTGLRETVASAGPGQRHREVGA
jgi:cysteine desulfurase